MKRGTFAGKPRHHRRVSEDSMIHGLKGKYTLRPVHNGVLVLGPRGQHIGVFATQAEAEAAIKRSECVAEPRRRRARETRYAKPPVTPSPLISRDFSSLPEVIEHARRFDGATHIVLGDPDTRIYFPAGSGYAEAVVWNERGYWHAAGPNDRLMVSRLPPGAERITATMWRARRPSGQRAAEPHVRSAHRMRAIGRSASHRRRPLGAPPAMTQDAVMQLAGELAKATGGSEPRYIQGGYRYSDPNESAKFVAYSPEYGQKVVVVVSVFSDGFIELGFFSDEGLSGTDRYENISSLSHLPGARVSKMADDVRWVLGTVDGYAASWDEGGEVGEHRRPPTPAPHLLPPAPPRTHQRALPPPTLPAGRRVRRPPPRAVSARRRAR